MIKIISCLTLVFSLFTSLYSSDLDINRLRKDISKENNLLEGKVDIIRGKDTLSFRLPDSLKNCNLSGLKMLNSVDKFYGSIFFTLPSGTFPQLSFDIVNPNYQPNKHMLKYGYVGIVQTKDEPIDVSGVSKVKMSSLCLELFDTTSLNKLASNQDVSILYLTYKKKGSFDFNILEKFPKLTSLRAWSINKFKNPESLRKYKINTYFFNNCNDYIFLSSIGSKTTVVVENMKIDGKLASKYLSQRDSPLNVAFCNCKVSDIDTLKKSSNLSALSVNGVRLKKEK